jgi:aspartate kinase
VIAASTSRRPLVVLKIGGSILTDLDSYARAARFVARRHEHEPAVSFVVVVSAQQGDTDAMQATAQRLASEPDPAMVDLLWSTGELRSVALLTLALQSLGVRATGANVHQAGLVAADRTGTSRAVVHPLKLRALLAAHEVVVVPGFLACAGDRVVSLGRGASDLTAVVLAAALGALRCELIKDVGGYYVADPKFDPAANHLPELDYDRSLAMADAGCGLVQRAALETARTHGLRIIVRAIDTAHATVLSAAAPAAVLKTRS